MYIASVYCYPVLCEHGKEGVQHCKESDRTERRAD